MGEGKFYPFSLPSPKYFGASDTFHRPPFPVAMCEKKMIILSFFLDARARRRHAARCGVGRADRRPPSGRDRGCACAERSHARGGKRCVTPSTSAQGAECLLPPLSSAWLCAGAGKVSDDDPVYSLAPVVAPGSTRARTRVHTTRTEPGCTHMIGVLCRGRCSPPGCAMGWA